MNEHAYSTTLPTSYKRFRKPTTHVRYCCPQQQKGALVMCLFSGGTTYLVQEEEKNNRGKQQLINVDIPESLPLPSSVCLHMARKKNSSNPSSEPLFAPGGADGNRGSSSSYLSDIFSEFTKHITPAFNHERPDRSVQMRLYTMHKGQHLLIFIMFLCLFFIAILMGLAGPSMTLRFKMEASKIKVPGNKTAASAVPRGPFNLVTPDLTSYQQQLWLSAQLVTKVATEQETFTKVCSVLLHVKGISDKDKVTVVGDRIHNRTRTIR